MSNDYEKYTPLTNVSPFITATYAGSSIAIRRDSDYDFTIRMIRATFGQLRSAPSDGIRILGKIPGYDQDILITQHLWADLLDGLTEITVVVFPVSQAVIPRARTIARTWLRAIFAKIHWRWRQLEDGQKLNDREKIPHKKPVDRDYHRCAKKPIIYLFPPVPIINASIQLSLVKAWDFSVVYPPTAISSIFNDGQSVTWTVDAKPDGTLLDYGTNREVSYLFWEALTKRVILPSPACSRPSSPAQDIVETFDPSRPIITPANSVVLSFDKITAYIDDALLGLGLHTEARCSFITYWLPDMQRHKHIALRFLPQDEYEVAAPMKITPAPDVVTRVFMLFRGIEEAELKLWEEARVGAFSDPGSWRGVVGVDVEKAKDMGLFRVLEWGGMEVY